ncbi:MAG: ABC transporter permease subunit [Dongiaceae bacterium]
MSVVADRPPGSAIQSVARIDRYALIWLAVLAFAVVCFVLRDTISWMRAPASDWLLENVPINDWLNVAMRRFVAVVRDPARMFGTAINAPLHWLRDFLLWMPWLATLVIITLLAWRANGIKLAVFAAITLTYMVVVGYWEESMVTLSLVGIAVPASAVIGLLLGIWGAHSKTAQRIIQPSLDVMQTVPTFAYLTPLILLLGYGPQVGLIAAIIFAIPPMVRNVMVGIANVAPNTVEAGQMAGSTRRQLTWWVEVPAAMPSIMMGLNQCVMAALSMVIIAAIIGGFDDIGWELLSTLRRAEFGPSLLSGIVIALLAMMIDRIGRGFSARAGETRLPRSGPLWRRYPATSAAILAVIVFVLLSYIFPALQQYPDDWRIYPAQPLNEMVKYVSTNWYEPLDAWKNATLFFYLLPLRIGLENSVRANYWGFDMSPTVTAVYVAILLGIAWSCFRKWGWKGVVPVVLLGGLYYFGATGTPWPAFMAIVVLLTVLAGGWRLGLFVFLALLFILLGNAWKPAMESLYLMTASVAVCFVLGSAIGIWAANSERVSAVMRPINDTLQTMPQFVYLIPVIMLFKIGDFSAMLAIIAYAIVPAIRYMEHGLRTVPAHVIEAARAIGCTERQILWQVRLPLALPQVMLGLNQTIMFAFAMLVIAALIGTRDLGQMVFGSMTSADFGMGVIAGGSIALLAMVTDRTLQALSAKQARRLGVA